MNITFSGTHDEETISQGVNLVSRPSAVSAVLRGLGVLFLLVVFAGTVYLFLGQGERTTGDVVRLALRVFTLPVLIYVLLRPYVDAPVIKKRMLADPTVRGPQAGVIDEEGITLHGMGGSTLMRWGELVRAEASDDLLVIQARGGPLTILPRRFFSTETDWQAVVRWAETSGGSLRSRFGGRADKQRDQRLD